MGRGVSVRIALPPTRGRAIIEVPTYNGALFSADDFEGAALLESLELGDPDFARVLLAVGRDATEGSGLDYSSLEIGHLGHIYEALLSLRLSVADRPLRYDSRQDRYVPVQDSAQAEIVPGSLLWQTNEGGRKAGGVYYTPVSLVRHLVNHAVVPAYERHLDSVRENARTDPRRAAADLLDFAVLDPACGSAHFLVQVTEALADRAVAFLAEVPLPAIREALDRLRAQAQGGAAVTDVALLRRLILKHCVFGVDLSPMGAEVATLSLWLASFVPGLSPAYLGRNVVVGNSLIGVGAASSVIQDGTWPAEALREALAESSEAAAKLAEIDDRTPSEVEASRAADADSRRATAGLRRLFDLWTAEGFGVKGARGLAETDGPAVIVGTNGANGEKLVEQAAALAREHRFLHWPLAFPRVFTGESPGFDVVVGNPPWEEVTVEGPGFYVMAALARRVGVPFRSGGQFTSSKAPDAQAAYESAHTLLPTLQAGVNFVLHAAGWLEGGLALSYEKLILDADQLGAMEVLARGVDTSDNGLALEAFRTNAHGDHFLGNPHTLANFETAFWRSELADHNSYEQWLEEDSLTAAQRANARWKQMLADYEPPPVDEAVDAELRDFVARRKAEMPDEIG